MKNILISLLCLGIIACDNSNPTNSATDPLDGLYVSFERQVRVPNLALEPVWVKETITYHFHEGSYEFRIDVESDRNDLLLSASKDRFWANGLYKILESNNNEYKIQWQRLDGQEFNFSTREYEDLNDAIWVGFVLFSIDDRLIQIGDTLYTIESE